MDKELSRQVKALACATKDASKIIVLARLFLQLTGLETQFLIDRVPYEVRGQKPFYERRENVMLFNYLQLGLELHAPVEEDIKKRLP